MAYSQKAIDLPARAFSTPSFGALSMDFFKEYAACHYILSLAPNGETKAKAES
jgi:hypothetical protein